MATVTGLLFSLVLSLVLTLASAAHIPGTQALERAGIDMAMRLFVFFPNFTDPRPGQVGDAKYVFVDVDEDACGKLSGEDRSCAEGGLITVNLILDFVRQANTSGARVVILDVAPPANTKAAEALRTGLATYTASESGPWIVIPLTTRPEAVTRPSGTKVSTTDRPSMIIETGETSQFLAPIEGVGRLRLASIVTTDDPVAGDGVIRNYPLTTILKGDTDKDDRIMPTAPFLAAMLSDRRTAKAMDCHFYGPTGCPAAGSPPFEARLSFSTSGIFGNRIYFTLPALSQQTEVEKRADDGVYDGRYTRFIASNLIENGSFEFDGDLVDAIVILGSSEPGAEDLHATPLGRMSGAEIILNATRALRDFAPIKGDGGPEETPLLFGLAEKLKAASIGAACFFPAWLIIFGLRSRFDRVPDAGHETLGGHVGQITVRFAVIVVSVLVFSLAIFAAMAWELTGKISELRSSADAGVLVNALTPVVAVGLEGFAEAAKATVARLERWVLWAVGRLELIFGWLVTMTRKT